jgi:hypothetical protein
MIELVAVFGPNTRLLPRAALRLSGTVAKLRGCVAGAETQLRNQ